MDVKELLNKYKDGKITEEQAISALKAKPFEDLGFAKPDYHRHLRQGENEVIYAEGKTAAQIAGIVQNMTAHGIKNILITRVSPEKYAEISDSINAVYYDTARIAVANPENVERIGSVAIVSGGTSDIPVCEEAAVTLEVLGNNVSRIYDVGVSGLHRLLARLDELNAADVIIAVAGMEGALASVVGGLADCPVIAVPTSVGYGANFEGLSALLAMLNSCASGVSAVNIDNGFGAGYLASMINKAVNGRGRTRA